MKKHLFILAFLAILFLPLAAAESLENTSKTSVTGHIYDLHGEPIAEAVIKAVYIGVEYEAESSSSGAYLLEIPGTPQKLVLEVSKPAYKSAEIEIGEFTGTQCLYASKDIVLDRSFGMAFYISALVLLLMYVIISFELLHRTNAALFGAALLLFITYTLGTFNPDYFIISFERAIEAIDFNVIFLLMGMMMIVAIMKNTGVFQWMAYKSYQLAKGDIWHLVVILMIVTAVTSAFLDNVTTMILLTPVVVEIALILEMSPLALIIPLVLASNVGGTATLIGDPPNIMIGSYAGLAFNDFIVNLAPVVAVSMLALIAFMKLWYGKEYSKVKVEDVEALMERLREEYKITDMKLLKYSLAVLFFIIVLFVIHGILHMEPSIAAITGASILLILSRSDVVKMLEEVEWPTLIFFMMLFVVVEATVETGLIGIIADIVKDLSGGDLMLAIILIIWVSAIASAIVDNIPFTATMLPIVAYLTQTIPGAESLVLWWALALGACFGGNGTLIGASANVVAAGISERAGHPISFMEFLKVGAPAMFITVFIATIYLLIAF